MELSYDLANGRDTTVISFVEDVTEYLPAYKNGYVWYPGMNSEIQVSTRWHKSRSDAENEPVEMLIKHGYKRPLWWQFWRWKEKPLPKALVI
jgi:hypothetical protein